MSTDKKVYCYWRDSLDCAFDACGVWAVWEGLTEEQRDNIAGSIEGSVENHGMASGRDCIPNPLESQMRERDARAAANLKDAETSAARREKELEDLVRTLRNRIYDLERRLETASR